MSQLVMETPQQSEPRSFRALMANKFGDADRDLLMALTASKIAFHNTAAPGDDDAMRYCRDLVQKNSGDPHAWIALGQCWLDVRAEDYGDASEALQCFEKLTEIDAHSAESWYGLGMVLQHLGEFGKAAEAYTKACKQEPDHVAAHFRLWVLGKAGYIPRNESIEPHRGPGGNFREITIGELRQLNPEQLEELRALHRYGVVVVRGAVDTARLDKATTLVKDFAQSYDYSKGPGIIHFSIIPEPLRQELEGIIQNELKQELLPAFSKWLSRGWEPFPNPSWWVQYYRPDRSGSPGTPWHQDHPVHCQRSDWTTFWTALAEAGPGLAPTLRVLTVPLRHPIDPVEQNLKRINPVPIEWIEEYFDRALVTIHANVGDVVTFGRYMIHNTTFDPAMTQDRCSFDVRFMTGPSRFGELGIFDA